jgi:pimeloyl-ACP methyl ester carboxylesterase
VILPDLRGYGDSSLPEAGTDHVNYSFRSMAQDLLEIMDQLGYREFYVAGHDRGARTTHRMCMDHPERILKVCLMDIVPNYYVWTHTTKNWAIGTWHWGFMAQPEPFPERLISAVPAEYFPEKPHGDPRRAPGSAFSRTARSAGVRALLHAEDDHGLVPRLSRLRDLRFRHGHGGQGQEDRHAAASPVGRARPSSGARARVRRHLAASTRPNIDASSRCLRPLHAGGDARPDRRSLREILRTKIAVLDDYADAARSLKAWASGRARCGDLSRSRVRPAVLGRRLGGYEAVVLDPAALAGSARGRGKAAPIRPLSGFEQTGPATAQSTLRRERSAASPLLRGQVEPRCAAQPLWALLLASWRHSPETAAIKGRTMALTVGRGQRTHVGFTRYEIFGSIVAGVGRAFGMKVICWQARGLDRTGGAQQDTRSCVAGGFFETRTSCHCTCRCGPNSRHRDRRGSRAHETGSALLERESRAALVGDQVLATH